MRRQSVNRMAATVCSGFLLPALACMSTASAQAWLPGKGQGTLGMTYEQKQSTKLTTADGSAGNFRQRLHVKPGNHPTTDDGEAETLRHGIPHDCCGDCIELVTRDGCRTRDDPIAQVGSVVDRYY